MATHRGLTPDKRRRISRWKTLSLRVYATMEVRGATLVSLARDLRLSDDMTRRWFSSDTVPTDQNMDRLETWCSADNSRHVAKEVARGS